MSSCNKGTRNSRDTLKYHEDNTDTIEKTREHGRPNHQLPPGPCRIGESLGPPRKALYSLFQNPICQIRTAHSVLPRHQRPSLPFLPYYMYKRPRCRVLLHRTYLYQHVSFQTGKSVQRSFQNIGGNCSCRCKRTNQRDCGVRTSECTPILIPDVRPHAKTSAVCDQCHQTPG